MHPSLLSEPGYMSEDGKLHSNFSATSSGSHWGVGVGLNLTLN
ncbi:hypothetical protein [Bartonella grahamii]|nr:hypothetical protein [Bartonella grahamii]